jgi:MFS family permease
MTFRSKMHTEREAVARGEYPRVSAGRLGGLALGYTLATAAFGGLAPLIAQQVIDATGWRLFPGLLVMLVALGVLPVIWRLPETARLPLSGSVSAVTIRAPRTPEPDGLQQRADDAIDTR